MMSDSIENDPYSNADLLKQDEIIYPDDHEPKKQPSRLTWLWFPIVTLIVLLLAMLPFMIASLFMAPY